MQLKAALLEKAAELGLDLVGVAPAAPFLKEQEYLRLREESGRGPNPYESKETERRIYPEMLLPGVQSIIAAGISYLAPDDESEPQPDEGPKGWLSRYCRGLDYHQLLKGRLEALAAWLSAAVPESHTLVYVDTGPPLDRAVAERAGVGKFGKNTMLITREYGTWVFLGEILTDVALPADDPALSACGTCTLCIDACPTQALTEWNLDANQCLSYVTQMKGIIPEEYREVMGNRLFGCDDCQDVCPYNRRAKPGGHAEFTPVPEVGGTPNLLQMMAMTKGDFKRWFEPTAAGWRGKTTIQRNALVALGNAGDPQGFPALRDALASDSQVLRAHAAWGIGRLAQLAPVVLPEAREALERRLSAETDAEVRLEIENALQKLNH